MPRGTAVIAVGTLAIAAAATGPAAALELEFVNQSAVPDSQLYITLNGEDAAFPAALPENAPRTLAGVPGNSVSVTGLNAATVLVGYGNGVAQNQIPPANQNSANVGTTRFGLVEFSDVLNGDADISYVNQFGVPFRIDTLDAQGGIIETRAPTCNATSVVAQLGKIPGAPVKTGPGGEFLRVVGPNQLGLNPQFPQTYPSLDSYVASLEGQALHVTTLFDPTKNVATYQGTIQNGVIVLTGTMTKPPTGPNANGGVPTEIRIPLTTESIYSANGTYTVNGAAATVGQNDIYAQIYNRVVSGFALGYWGGKYGNSVDDQPGSPTPGWWQQPAFSAARTGPQPYATYSQYAEVIANTTGQYGYPFSDSLPFSPLINVDGVPTLRITILPDNAPEPASCNPQASSANPPASPPSPPPSPPAAPTSGSTVCNPAPPAPKKTKKGKIENNRAAYANQQRISQAAMLRLNEINKWIDAGIVPSDLCADAFGQSAFQAGVPWAGGAPAVAETPPSPRPLPKPPKRKPDPSKFGTGERQARINYNIAEGLRARAEATWKRLNVLTGGNLAPGASLAGRPLFAGLTWSGPLPGSSAPPPAELEIRKWKKVGRFTLDAKFLQKTQRKAQDAIILANRAEDRIAQGLTEAQFAPDSIGSGSL